MTVRKKRNKLKFKTKLRILIVVILAGLILDSTFLSMNRVLVNKVKIESEVIPKSFANTKILVFSDIDDDIKQLNKIEKIAKKESVDFIVYLGHLELGEDNKAIQEKLKNLDAPLGKFAVLSPLDYRKEVEETKNLLTQAGFRVQSTQVSQVYNKTTDPIQFLFIDSHASDKESITALNEQINNELLSISFAYDQNKDLSANYNFSSKYEYSKVNIPVINDFLYKDKNTKNHELVDSKHYYQTNGISTEGNNLRFLTSPNAFIIELKPSK